MSGVAILPLRFQIGSRTLAAIPRRMVRVAMSLEDVLAGRVPVLPPTTDDGYLVTSLPVERMAEVATAGQLVHVRQGYTRHYLDLMIGETGWEAALSASTRAGLKRKARKLSDATITRFATPADIATFHPLARQVSATTYQERLLDAGLPATADTLLDLARADRVRAWLLQIDGRPIAYLCCTAVGATLRYDHVGHDPAYSAKSPGAVLQAAALRDLLIEKRFRWFDFTEGDGQHKRSLATGGVECVDLLLLRPTLPNRLVVAALTAFDRGVAGGKRLARYPLVSRVAKRVRR